MGRGLGHAKGPAGKGGGLRPRARRLGLVSLARTRAGAVTGIRPQAARCWPAWQRQAWMCQCPPRAADADAESQREFRLRWLPAGLQGQRGPMHAGGQWQLDEPNLLRRTSASDGHQSEARLLSISLIPTGAPLSCATRLECLWRFRGALGRTE